MTTVLVAAGAAVVSAIGSAVTAYIALKRAERERQQVRTKARIG